MQFDSVRECSLAELLTSDGGSVKTGPFGTALKADEYSMQGVPLISVREVVRGGFHVDERTPRITESTIERLPEYVLQKGDIVFARKGSVERCALVGQREAGWFLGSDGIRLRPPKTVNARFLSYIFQSTVAGEWLKQQATGSTMASLNQSILLRFPLTLPSMEVQSKVAEFLGALDDRIILLRQTNTTLESIAHALFKSWFIDFDLVRANAEGREPEGMDAEAAALFPDEFEDSALGEIPKGWRASTLEGLTAIGEGLIQTGPFGSQLHASDYSDEGVPVVMPQDLDGRRISTARVARVSSEHVERLSRHKLRPGDIVFSRRGDVGRHATVTSAEAGWLCGTGCLLVRPGDKWPSRTYVSLALATATTSEWLHRHAVGATMPNLNTGILGGLPVLLPGEPTLLAFEKVAGALEERISANLAQVQILAGIRDAMLPRLVSGKLRLPEAEAQLNEALP